MTNGTDTLPKRNQEREVQPNRTDSAEDMGNFEGETG